MNTTIIRKNFWGEDEFIEFHLDTKITYLYLLLSTQKNYITVFKFNRSPASLATGLSKESIEAALFELKRAGYIDVYEGYVGLLKDHVAKVGGQHGPKNEEREIAALPIDIREHFNIDSTNIIVVKEDKKEAKKPGPKPETIKDILDKQDEVLRASLKELIEDRKERKNSPTTRAVKRWVNKLNKMYPNNVQKQVESIEQTIEHGWAGLFEVKSDKSKGGGKFL